MKPIMTAAIASGVLAIAAGEPATASTSVLFTTVDLSNVSASTVPEWRYPDSYASNAPLLGQWTVFDEFTLSQYSTITEFGYFSYFNTNVPSSTYKATNWSIWRNATQVVVATTSTIGTVTAPPMPQSEPTLVTVNGLNVHLAAGTYWIGYQNSLTNPPLSDYALSNSDLLTAIVGTMGGPDPTVTRSLQAAFFIAGMDAPEPSTWAMTLLGFAGLAWAARLARPRPA